MNARIGNSNQTIQVSRAFFLAPLVGLALHAYSRLVLVVSGVLVAMIVFGSSQAPIALAIGLFISGLGAIVLRRQLAKVTAAYGKALIARTQSIKAI